MKHKHLFIIVLLLAFFLGLNAQTTTLSVGTQVAAADVSQGTLKHPILHFQLDRDNAGTVNLTDVSFTTGGDYSAAFVYKFQLWYNTSNSISSATQLSSDITATLGTGSHSFASFEQALAANSTTYFWITTNVAIDASTTKIINVSAWDTSNFSVSDGTKSGSATASGDQTIRNFVSISADYFRSKNTTSGYWSVFGTWQSSHDNDHWATATSYPTTTASAINILDGHTVSMNLNHSTEKTTVDAGGLLKYYSSSKTLTISNGTGIDMTVNGSLENSGPIIIESGAEMAINGLLTSSGKISGAGAFTLNSGAELIISNSSGITSSGASGAIQVTGSRTFSNEANYTYRATSTQVTGNGLPSSVNNLTLDNSGLSLTNALTVNGVFTQISGSVSGSSLSVDGYSAIELRSLEIGENDKVISGLSVSTSDIEAPVNRIDREWNLSGSFDDTKAVTFYWNGFEDNDIIWGGGVFPAVYIGNTEYTQTEYDVVSEPHWVTVNLPTFSSKAIYRIGINNDQPLPVELSSFTVALNSYNNVTLQWVTQSETNASGFRIYRSSEAEFETAQMLSRFVNATNTSQMQIYVVTDDEVYEDGAYYYWLENANMDGSSEMHGPISIQVSLTGNNPAPEIQVKQGINSTYPNPFNPTVNISYKLDKQAKTKLSVYNQRGQLVRTLLSGELKSGVHNASWNGKDDAGNNCSSGIYLFVMETGGKRFTKRATLLK